jgi:hypothetical protein
MASSSVLHAVDARNHWPSDARRSNISKQRVRRLDIAMRI